MVYDATSNRIYLTLYDTSEVAVIDPETNTVVARWSTNPARSPRALALDSANGRLFVSGAYLVVVDIKSGKVISSADITRNVESVAFDSTSRRIYCAGPEAITVLQANQDGVMFVGTPLLRLLEASSWIKRPSRSGQLTARAIRLLQNPG